MDIFGTLASLAGILSLFYVVFIGQKTLKEWWQEKKKTSSSDDLKGLSNNKKKNVKQLGEAILDSQTNQGNQSIEDVHILLGAYLSRANNGDKLAIPWLIEFSMHPSYQIRLLCCTKGFSSLQKFNKEVMERLVFMEESDPHLEVRKAARKTRAKLALLRK